MNKLETLRTNGHWLVDELVNAIAALPEPDRELELLTDATMDLLSCLGDVLDGVDPGLVIGPLFMATLYIAVDTAEINSQGGKNVNDNVISTANERLPMSPPNDSRDVGCGVGAVGGAIAGAAHGFAATTTRSTGEENETQIGTAPHDARQGDLFAGEGTRNVGSLSGTDRQKDEQGA